MTKQEILDQIKRVASKNRGMPPGRQSFQRETGITRYEVNKYWARWSDAVEEAGFAPNQMQIGYESDFLIEKLIALAREIRHFPTQADFRVKAFNESGFPHPSTFGRLGLRSQQITRVADFCQNKAGMEDILHLCEEASKKRKDTSANRDDDGTDVLFGHVYLIKAGKYYKIGKTKSIGRREYDLAIQLAEKPTTIHVIKTDDPDGVEAYWHKRLAAKRKNGEWFDLNATDVKAFKKWIRIA